MSYVCPKCRKHNHKLCSPEFCDCAANKHKKKDFPSSTPNTDILRRASNK